MMNDHRAYNCVPFVRELNLFLFLVEYTLIIIVEHYAMYGVAMKIFHSTLRKQDQVSSDNFYKSLIFCVMHLIFILYDSYSLAVSHFLFANTFTIYICCGLSILGQVAYD